MMAPDVTFVQIGGPFSRFHAMAIHPDSDVDEDQRSYPGGAAAAISRQLLKSQRHFNTAPGRSIVRGANAYASIRIEALVLPRTSNSIVQGWVMSSSDPRGCDGRSGVFLLGGLDLGLTLRHDGQTRSLDPSWPVNLPVARASILTSRRN